MNEIKLQNILMKFANRVLDTRDGKENPTLGELLDTPAAEIMELVEEYRVDAIRRHIQPYLDYCQKVNGQDSCKNCGLEELNKSKEK